jgi:hypothetical protein
VEKELDILFGVEGVKVPEADMSKSGRIEILMSEEAIKKQTNNT